MFINLSKTHTKNQKGRNQNIKTKYHSIQQHFKTSLSTHVSLESQHTAHSRVYLLHSKHVRSSWIDKCVADAHEVEMSLGYQNTAAANNVAAAGKYAAIAVDGVHSNSTH